MREKLEKQPGSIANSSGFPLEIKVANIREFNELESYFRRTSLRCLLKKEAKDIGIFFSISQAALTVTLW